MATSKNAITGDLIQTKLGDQDAYSNGWDRIFGKMREVEERANALDVLVKDAEEMGLYEDMSSAPP